MDFVLNPDAVNFNGLLHNPAAFTSPVGRSVECGEDTC